MSNIQRVLAREVLDSRGRPTVEVEIDCGEAIVGRAIVPSGASTGKFEAVEKRDGDPTRYDGDGVQQAVETVRQVIGPKIVGMDPREQFELDDLLLCLDDTPQKSKLGANAVLGVSLAAAHTAAALDRRPLFSHLHDLYGRVREREAPKSVAETSVSPSKMPIPMINMISGGLHAGGNLDFQDVLIVPHGADEIAMALEWTVRVYRRLGELLGAAGFEGRLVGDEGGFGPRLSSNQEAIEFVVRAIETAGLRPGEDVSLSLDVAATHFFDGSHYRLAATGEDMLTAAELIDHLEVLVDQFPIAWIEDGLAEDDWNGWQKLTVRLGDRVKLIGDDLFVTNAERLQRGIDQGVANAILIKVNQIGTLTEALEATWQAAAAGYARVVSARSGETEDSTIADLAVAVAADSIKIGSIVRGERLAKYNQLLRISEALSGG